MILDANTKDSRVFDAFISLVSSRSGIPNDETHPHCLAYHLRISPREGRTTTTVTQMDVSGCWEEIKGRENA
jgi:hypothetical protein